MFLITFGLAATLSLTRYLLSSDADTDSLYVICFLPLFLPMISLARYAAQDMWEVSASKNKHSQLDPRFLSEDERLMK